MYDHYEENEQTFAEWREITDKAKAYDQMRYNFEAAMRELYNEEFIDVAFLDENLNICSDLLGVHFPKKFLSVARQEPQIRKIGG